MLDTEANARGIRIDPFMVDVEDGFLHEYCGETCVRCFDSGEYGDAFDEMPWEYLEWRGVTWSTIMARPALVETVIAGMGR